MSKAIKGYIKLQLEAGKATPAPPVGPALGQHGVNIKAFCDQFNEATKGKNGSFPTVITVYIDKTFDILIKKPSNSYLVKDFLKITSGSKTPGKEVIKKCNFSDVVKYVKDSGKIENMNARDDIAAAKTFCGSLRSFGVEIDYNS